MKTRTTHVARAVAAVVGSLMTFGTMAISAAPGIRVLPLKPSDAPVSRVGQSAAARSNRLRIVIVEGENGINIIQQGTAIAPVVEVRDRNDQPVSGATVTFAVRGGRATFNGARTVTVSTNAVGRATPTGLTPTSSGAFQISASTSFQGQTAAVTIAQTNVMTAAQAASIATAAAAGSAVGVGAAAAAGGGATGAGLSAATTLGIIGGAVGGGLLVTRQAILGGFTDYKGPFRMEVVETSSTNGGRTPPCTSTLALQGTLTLELTEDNGTLGGELVSEWTFTEIARTCPNPKGSIEPARRGSPVSGTTGNVQVNDQYGSATNGVSSNTIQFSGAISGDALVGTWSIADSYVGLPAGNGDVYSSATPLTSVSVTLLKQ